MHGVRMLVVTTLLAVVAVGVVAGGASATPIDTGSDAVTGTERAASDVNATDTRVRQTGANVTVLVAPGAALDSMLSATSSQEYGPRVTLSARPRVTLSDVLVLRIRAPGLEEAVRAQPGNSTTQRFFSLLESDEAELIVGQYGPQDETQRAIDPTDASAVSIVPSGNNTYDLVMDLSTVDATLDENNNNRPDDNRTVPVDTGDTYRVNFTFRDVRTQRFFGVFPVAVIFLPNQPGNNPRLRPAPNQTIHARTTLAPGTHLTVELTVDAADIFRRSQEVTVVNSTRSQFTARFNLTGVADGVDISVIVEKDGRAIGATTGRIPELSASLSLPRRADQRNRILIENVSFSQGGFLIVRDGGPSGTIVANRYLAGGNYTNLSVLLVRAPERSRLTVTAYADLDGDRAFDARGPDRPYRHDGNPVRATIRLPSTTPTPGPTTRTTSPDDTTPTPDTETATPTARLVTPPPSTTTTVVTPRPIQTKTTTGEFTPYTITPMGAPGFGVGVALVAIVALVALLTRQRGRQE